MAAAVDEATELLQSCLRGVARDVRKGCCRGRGHMEGCRGFVGDKREIRGCRCEQGPRDGHDGRSRAGRPWVCGCGRGRGRREGGGLPLRTEPVMAVQDVGRDHADGHEGCRCRRGLGEGERGLSLQWRRWEHRGGHRLDMAAWDGGGGCVSNRRGCWMAALLPQQVTPGACLQAVAGKLLQRSHLAQEPLCFCRCSRRNCRHLHVELHLLGSAQLGSESAKSLWQYVTVCNLWLANQVKTNAVGICAAAADASLLKSLLLALTINVTNSVLRSDEVHCRRWRYCTRKIIRKFSYREVFQPPISSFEGF